MEEKMKFCKHCGQQIPFDAVICTKCGRQVEEMHSSSDKSAPIIINNNNSSSSSASATASANGGYGNARMRNKWVALLLCLCLGYVGAHKFYECKTGMGILYLCTFGLCGVGIVIDAIALLFKPNPYHV